MNSKTFIVKLFRYIVSIILLLLSVAGTAQTVQNDVSPSDSPIIFRVVIENKDGYWISGYIKSNGEVIAKPQFYKASNFINGMARVRFLDDDNSTTYIDTSGKVLKQKFDWFSEHFTPDGLCMVRDYETEKKGIINKKGEYVIKPQFDEIGDFSDGLARVKVDGKYGYIDYKGEMVVKPNFVMADFYFSEDLAFVKIDTVEWRQKDNERFIRHVTKVGFIDKIGKYVIPPQFDLAGYFHHGLAWVKIDDKYGFIDKTGKYVIKPQYDDADNFRHGLAWVKIDDKYGFIDKTGNMVVEPQFDTEPEYKNGFYIVSKHRYSFNYYYGLVDTTGKIIFEPKSMIKPIFYEDYARISTGERRWVPSNYGYIDKTGKIVIEPQFDFSQDFCNGFAQVSDETDLYGFINKKGELVIPYQFKKAEYFSENGLAAVQLDDKWGYIDTTGKFVIEPKFQYAGSFRNGMARVEINDKKWGYIDMTGKYLQLYDYVGEFQNGFATFHKNKKVGVIDTTGKIIIEPKYDEIFW